MVRIPVDRPGRRRAVWDPHRAGDAWFYKRNLSPICRFKTNGREEVKAHFAPLELVAMKPSLAALSAGGQQFLDLAGDGQPDLVALSGPTPGLYERTDDEGWEPFRPFTSRRTST